MKQMGEEARTGRAAEGARMGRADAGRPTGRIPHGRRSGRAGRRVNSGGPDPRRAGVPMARTRGGRGAPDEVGRRGVPRSAPLRPFLSPAVIGPQSASLGRNRLSARFDNGAEKPRSPCLLRALLCAGIATRGGVGKRAGDGAVGKKGCLLCV
ncbi:hypothetical protein GCM10010510_10450 [Streptomyces anandii JCM 4720]|nr:hypothetical protein GCM10010510_10450 [Streptomyces anandii JCM 4720]